MKLTSWQAPFLFSTNFSLFTSLLLLLSAPSDLNAQMIIWSEDFEDHGNTANGGAGRYTSNNDFMSEATDDDYWGRIEASTREYFLTDASSGFTTHSNVTYVGQNGNFYYAGEDLDSDANFPYTGTPDGLDEKGLSFSGINITGGTNLEFRGLFAAGENDPCDASVYDNADYINVYYNVDNDGEVLALCFNPDLECNLPSDFTNEPLFHDPDCDGDGGEGTLMTATFAEFSFSIPSGSNLDLRIEAHLDAGSEEVAFDYFRVLSDSPLPIKLVAFNATAEGENILLDWETATEINNDYFLVEHSRHGELYRPIGRIIGNGNSKSAQRYYFTHNEPDPGINYYRLKQIDFDGTISYSNIITEFFESGVSTGISVYPNPFVDKIQLQLHTKLSQSAFLEICNFIGWPEFNLQLDSGVNETTLDLSNLPNGVYFMSLWQNGQMFSRRLVKY